MLTLWSIATILAVSEDNRVADLINGGGGGWGIISGQENSIWWRNCQFSYWIVHLRRRLGIILSGKTAVWLTSSIISPTSHQQISNHGKNTLLNILCHHLISCTANTWIITHEGTRIKVFLIIPDLSGSRWVSNYYKYYLVEMKKNI